MKINFSGAAREPGEIIDNETPLSGDDDDSDIEHEVQVISEDVSVPSSTNRIPPPPVPPPVNALKSSKSAVAKNQFNKLLEESKNFFIFF